MGDGEHDAVQQPLDLDSCMLCGCLMHASVERRYKQIQYLDALIRDKCMETPFVFQHITDLALYERQMHAVRPGCACPCKGTALPAIAIPEIAVQLAAGGGGGGAGAFSAISEQPAADGAAGAISEQPVAVEMDDSDSITDEMLEQLLDGEDGEEEADDDDGGVSEYPGICTVGARAGFCVSCINWVRRRAKAKRVAKDKLPMIPMDKHIMFVADPGSCKEPDKRSMFRLLQNQCIRYTHVWPKGVEKEPLCVGNPYNRFLTHVHQRVCAMFRRKFFPSWRFDTTLRHLWDEMRTAKNQPGPDSNGGLLKEVIRVWWECNGLPQVVHGEAAAARGNARFVRRSARKQRPVPNTAERSGADRAVFSNQGQAGAASRT